MRNRLVLLQVATAAYVLVGCTTTSTPPTPPENPVTLKQALNDIREGILSIQPKKGDEAMGVWLTEVEVVLKIDQKRSGESGLVVGLPDAALVGTKLTYDSKAEASAGNTITIRFKNPLNFEKDTVFGQYSSPQASATAEAKGKPGDKKSAQVADHTPAIPIDGQGPTRFYSAPFSLDINGILREQGKDK